jgi:ATP-dependent DNA helicase RecQ
MRRVVHRTRALPKGRAGPADLSLPDADLLQRLKAWRLGEARTQAVPAYVILHDSTLADIARRRPSDRMALARIAGIGATKLDRYGAALLQAVAEG